MRVAGWSLILAVAGLPGEPAGRSAAAVRARATAPLPSLRMQVALELDRRPVGTAVVLLDGDRVHAALRGPLGQPVAVLRAQDGVLALELVGERELVAADGEWALGWLTGGLGVEDLGRLLLGRAPRGLGALDRVPGGWAAVGEGAALRFDRDGALVDGQVGPLQAQWADGALTLTEGAWTARLRVVGVEPATPPERAFEVGRSAVPVVGIGGSGTWGVGRKPAM